MSDYMIPLLKVYNILVTEYQMVNLVSLSHECVCVWFQVFSGRGGMQASGDVSQLPIHTVHCTAQYTDTTLSTETHTASPP